MYAAHTAPARYAPDAAAVHLSARPSQPPTTNNVRQPHVESSASVAVSRLGWLEAALADDERRRQLFRDAREEEEMLLMRRPLAPERAYARFGLLLGALPPAAIVLKLAWVFLFHGDGWTPTLVMLLFGVPMTLICALVGRLMGRRLAPMLARAERRSRTATVLYALWAGFVWACLTGAAGGAVVFIIGALYGAACALPFGLAGFVLFAACRRLLARGGMMDARHFWPVACGIALTGAALILGIE